MKHILAVMLSFSLLLTPAISSSMSTLAVENSSQSETTGNYTQGEAIVRFKDDQLITSGGILSDSEDWVVEKSWNLNNDESINASFGAQSSEPEKKNAAIVKSSTLSTQQIIKKLEERSDVMDAEPNYTIELIEEDSTKTNDPNYYELSKAAGTKTNDPDYDKQWGIDNQEI